MKKSLVFFALALSASVSQAASISSCLDSIRSCTYLNFDSDRTQMYTNDLGRSTECKIIQAGEREDGSVYQAKTVFFDNNTILSINTRAQYDGSCDGSKAQLNGRITDSAAKDGRLYMSHSSGSLIVVARDNKIFEVLNSKGDSYKTVVGVAVDQNSNELILQRENNQETRLNMNQLTERINARSKVRCLSNNCN